MVDTDMTGKERREAVWEAIKVGFISMLANMTAEVIKNAIINAAIKRTEDAAEVAAAATKGTTIAATEAGIAATAATAEVAIATTAQAAAIAAAIVTSTAIASAWATAAALAATATFGGAAGAGLAAITGTITATKALALLNQGGEVLTGSNRNVDSVPAILTKKEIVVNRDSAQANRGILLGINNDKKFIQKNFVPRNLGGEIGSLNQPMRFPTSSTFPNSMNINSSQLDKLIGAVKAQTMNQQRQGSGDTTINIKSSLDGEKFIIEQDKTREKMTERGYTA
jgi:hypothetical protein